MKNNQISLKIGICNGSNSTINTIEPMIQKKEKTLKIGINIFRFTLDELITDKISKYDIIFLELLSECELNKIANYYKYLKRKEVVIVISKDDGHAQMLLELEIFRLLVKPIDELIFNKYFYEAINRIKTISPIYSFRYNKIRYKLQLKQIIYFQSDKRITYIITDNRLKRIYPCYKTLNRIEEEIVLLTTTFCRIHQSFFVNLLYVKSYTESSIELNDGTVLGISRRRKKETIKRLEELNIPSIIQ